MCVRQGGAGGVQAREREEGGYRRHYFWAGQRSLGSHDHNPALGGKWLVQVIHNDQPWGEWLVHASLGTVLFNL